jgi:hypothetical protein
MSSERRTTAGDFLRFLSVVVSDQPWSTMHDQRYERDLHEGEEQRDDMVESTDAYSFEGGNLWAAKWYQEKHMARSSNM